ncbi:hypothetical protein GCM10011344_04390 [Dokdonia pacifica]|uniref:Uncharacterized protein n=1 Tax=Dokdonia pacifica TaxID=1627892 RepID=A0A238ZJU5_9FLAO|nr:hypothetical protein [Dokdonia pacifica]GGG07026.1 hypothetical protein GCM10011344_04390 [Dokdonia pacifica]SNR83736.1 hypothetical protein SAMN06265376_103301 [Dokdonia pacifica]
MYIFRLVVAILILTATTVSAQNKAEKVELIDMAKDLIITKKQESNIKQVWWIPSEYWRIALTDSPDIGEEIITDIETKLVGYSLFSVVNSDISPFSGFKKRDATITIIHNNEILLPLPEEEIPTDIKELIDVFRPTLAGMAGQLGEQMIFYVFKNELEDGTTAISPYNTGKLYVKVNDVDFIYRLPLQSMVAKKVCPEDQEQLNGNWDYCPWHGIKLIEQN